MEAGNVTNNSIFQKDYDDFYSLANEVFAKVITDYDESRSFEAYLYSCLDRKIKTEITRRNRMKRQVDRNSVSIDTPLEDGSTIQDIVASDYNLESEIFGEDEVENPKIKAYLDRLSKIQRKIILMISADFGSEEIEEQLHISHKQFLDSIEAIHSYRNISILL